MNRLISLALGFIVFYIIVGWGLIDYIDHLMDARDSLQAMLDAF